MLKFLIDHCWSKVAHSRSDNSKRSRNRVVLTLEVLGDRLVPSTIVRELGEFSGAEFDKNSAFPRPAVQVGTFDFAKDLGGRQVKSATIRGTFGNSVYGHTSGVNLFLDGVRIATAEPYGPAWYGGGTWSHTFSRQQLQQLQDGVAKLTAVQTNEFVIRLGASRLEVETGVEINYLSRKTFITTDEITLRASAPAGTQIKWTVEGRGAAAGITGFPTNVVTTADQNGVATFRFTPSNNQALVNDRRTRWTRGSTTANPAISFEVTAKATIAGVESMVRLSNTTLGPLTQDETDRLRQEYLDYNIPVPTRDEVVRSLGAGFNQGNYGVQLSVGLPNRYNAILAAYRGSRVTATINGQQYTTTIPNNAVLSISSGYRNPQRNKAIGSMFPDSKHTRGRALDLVPGAVQVQITVNGQRRTVTLNLHKTLYPALQVAAATQGSAIAEQGATQVPVGDTRENHIHVQWTG